MISLSIASLYSTILKDAQKLLDTRYENIEKGTIFISKKDSLYKAYKKSICHYYKVDDDYAIILSSKVKSKNIVAMYTIDDNITIKDIDILVFKEPFEYKPSKDWVDTLKSGKAPNITGATLSARSMNKQSSLLKILLNKIRTTK